MEHPELEWNGRIAYLIARHDLKQPELYSMDLLWSIARKNYGSDIPMPSELLKHKKIDKRSAKQIMHDIVNGLGGG